jgi:hypothetical protein
MIGARLLKSKRFWTWLVLGCLAISILGPAVWILIPKPGINRQNYHKIQVGMTLDEVTALMGHPPGNHAKPTSVIVVPDSESMGDTAPGQKFWMSDSGFIIVVLDENDRVRGAAFTRVQDASILGRLYRFLGY